MNPWNDRNLLAPPLHTFYSTNYFNADDLKSSCDEITRVLTKQSPLHKEGAIVSRLIYKFDKKFRNDLGYRRLKKVNTSLRRYLSLNFIKDVETFNSMIPLNSEELYLPTRQMLEYVLVRLITFAKLMLQIYVTAKQAAIFYLDRLKRGESHWMSLMPYAVLSRIWSIVTVLIQHACRWYSTLYEFLHKLEFKGVPFLNNGFELPIKLDEIINIQELDDLGRFNWSINKVIEVAPFLNEVEDNEGFDLLKYVKDLNATLNINNEVENEENLNENSTIDNMKNAFQPPVIKQRDEGEVVSRKCFTTISSKLDLNMDKMEIDEVVNKIQNSEDTMCMSYEDVAQSITNGKTLKIFMAKEENLRNENDNRSLTGHLSFMQWEALKQNCLHLCKLGLSSKKLTKRFNKIWKEKCLDYLL